jgi:hypothetical protein
MEDLTKEITIVYYTSNYLDDKNPYFLENTRKQLLVAIGDRPMVIVSQKPTMFGNNSINVNLGNIGRSHFNLYWQILQGAKAAKTEWIALAEDDILYSPQHFNIQYFVKPEFIEKDYFLYDMNRVSIFTWSKPPVFSYRFKRVVVNQLIAKRQMLIDALEERFKKLDELRGIGWPERKIEKYWGDPGRYEGILGVTVRPTYEYNSWVPSIVFSHDLAYGYEFNQGKKKKLGDLRMTALADWGSASKIMSLWKK